MMLCNEYAPGVLSDHFEHMLSGKAFWQLDNAQSAISDDLFLVNKSTNEDLSSYSTSYATFLSNIISSFFEKLALGSMTYEDTWKYSPACHNHNGDYNRATFTDTVTQADKICIATVSSSTSESDISVCVPRIDICHDEIEIGTLKFVCSKALSARITDSSLSSNTFDGWVYADGSVFTVTNIKRYEKAIRAFGSSQLSSNQFMVPCLSSFLKATPSQVTEFKTKDQVLGVAEHAHEILPLDFSGDIKLQQGFSLSTYVQNNGSESSAIGRKNGKIQHGLDDVKSIGEAEFHLDMEQINFSLSCGMHGSQNQMFKPRHNKIPVMIYVGGVVS